MVDLTPLQWCSAKNLWHIVAPPRYESLPFLDCSWPNSSALLKEFKAAVGLDFKIFGGMNVAFINFYVSVHSCDKNKKVFDLQ